MNEPRKTDDVDFSRPLSQGSTPFPAIVHTSTSIKARKVCDFRSSSATKNLCEGSALTAELVLGQNERRV